MSGPYCKSCSYFYRGALGSQEFGECNDPSKIISNAKSGNSVNSAPEIHENCCCDNHNTSEAWKLLDIDDE